LLQNADHDNSLGQHLRVFLMVTLAASRGVAFGVELRAAQLR
jgi:hypothetical protein